MKHSVENLKARIAELEAELAATQQQRDKAYRALADKNLEMDKIEREIGMSAREKKE